ncbi:MAG: hypothetical protein V2A73_16795, partial [Pseudomonadota bacterium]
GPMDGYYTRHQAGQILGLSKSRVRQLEAKGLLRTHPGADSTILIDADDVERLRQTRVAQGRCPPPSTPVPAPVQQLPVQIGSTMPMQQMVPQAWQPAAPPQPAWQAPMQMPPPVQWQTQRQSWRHATANAVAVAIEHDLLDRGYDRWTAMQAARAAYDALANLPDAELANAEYVWQVAIATVQRLFYQFSLVSDMRLGSKSQG